MGCPLATIRPADQRTYNHHNSLIAIDRLARIEPNAARAHVENSENRTKGFSRPGPATMPARASGIS